MTEIRLLVVMVQQRVLRAVMMIGYTIRYAGSGLSRGVLCIWVLESHILLDPEIDRSTTASDVLTGDARLRASYIVHHQTVSS